MIHVRHVLIEWDGEAWVVSDLRRIVVRRFRTLLAAENYATRGCTEGEVAA